MTELVSRNFRLNLIHVLIFWQSISCTQNKIFVLPCGKRNYKKVLIQTRDRLLGNYTSKVRT